MDDREKLMERYDDAAFALMMDEYAEAEGEAILAEFRAAAEAGELPEFPEELDKACRNTIRREYARRERRVRLRQLRRAAARVAVAVFAVIGIMSTLVFSVEAWRVPLWKLIGENYGTVQDFDFGKKDKEEDEERKPLTAENDPFFLFVPEGYRQVFFEVENGRINSRYESEDGKYIEIDMSFLQNNSTTIIEEETEYKKWVSVLDQQAIFFSNAFLLEYSPDTEVYIELTWEDSETETQYRVMTNVLDETELVFFCEKVIRCTRDTYIDQPSEVPDALEGKLPEEYEQLWSDTNMGLFGCLYKSGEKMICFDTWKTAGTVRTYVENPVIKDATIAGYEATVMVGDNEMDEIGTIWNDEERKLTFYLTTTFMTEEEHLALCGYLAEYYKNVTQPVISTLHWK